MVNTSKIIASKFSTHSTINMELQKKKNPFGELIKHKARLCVHGGMQREVIYFHNTFTPVLNWSTVRLIIMMAEMVGW